MALSDVQHLLPRLKLGNVTTDEEFVEFIKERTGLHKSDVVAMLAELEDAIHNFNRMGRPVRLRGVGIFTPSIRLDGTIKVNFRQDRQQNERLNTSSGYTGEVLNRTNIGKTLTELEAMLTE